MILPNDIIQIIEKEQKINCQKSCLPIKVVVGDTNINRFTGTLVWIEIADKIGNIDFLIKPDVPLRIEDQGVVCVRMELVEFWTHGFGMDDERFMDFIRMGWYK